MSYGQSVIKCHYLHRNCFFPSLSTSLFIQVLSQMCERFTSTRYKKIRVIITLTAGDNEYSFKILAVLFGFYFHCDSLVCLLHLDLSIHPVAMITGTLWSRRVKIKKRFIYLFIYFHYFN